jgi:hypothetical protein
LPLLSGKRDKREYLTGNHGFVEREGKELNLGEGIWIREKYSRKRQKIFGGLDKYLKQEMSKLWIRDMAKEKDMSSDRLESKSIEWLEAFT